MNRPEHDDVESTDNGVQPTTEPATESAPFVAKMIVPSVDEVHVGSPFRQDPEDLPAESPAGVIFTASGEAAYGEFGPFLYTAMGASSAAVVVLFFAAAGAFWFPTGGALVAVLGTVLSIVGLFAAKRFRYAAFATLPMHMTLFFLSYVRSLG